MHNARELLAWLEDTCGPEDVIGLRFATQLRAALALIDFIAIESEEEAAAAKAKAKTQSRICPDCGHHFVTLVHRQQCIALGRGALDLIDAED